MNARRVVRTTQGSLRRREHPILHVGQVQSIQTATTPPSLTIKWSGGSVAQAGVNFLSSYAPQVNDWVEAIHTGPPSRPGGGDWLVLGTVGGDSGWIAPTLGNSWVNYGGTFQVAQYRKHGDVVRIRGVIKSGTINAVAFTLPAGYIPPADLQFAVVSNGAYGTLQVNGAGNANPGQVTPVNGNNVSVNVDCTFTVD